ncbi:hypothetical protein B566_EDAN011370 [Ephemera danica]|nr:hypothetical protein B566_EDAN011370 [Ephemera danica]
MFYSTSKNHAHARQSISVLKQRFFGSILLPSACLTAVNFWVIFWLVPHLMFDDLVAFYPGFLNHSMHTLVVPLVLLELFLTPQRAIKKIND